MANNRIFYAIQALGFAPHGVGSGPNPSGFVPAHGVQSVGMNTTFNLSQVFELGMLDIYENVEGIPDVELTAQKVLDGYPLLYHLATPTATGPSLVARTANQRVYAALNIYPDTYEAASGTPLQAVGMSGMYLSALTYTFNVDGPSTEDVTLVGNDKLWFASGLANFVPDFGGDRPLSLVNATSGGIQHREDVLMGEAANSSRFPAEIPGITSSGTNKLTDGVYGAHIQRVTVQCNLGRTDLFELGRRGPYYRYVNFPIEVTSAIETTTSDGDLIDAEADPASGTNLTDQPIKIAMREGTVVDLGTRNKLQSVTYGGGDAGGGNVAVTYNYRCFNTLTVTHPQDPVEQ